MRFARVLLALLFSLLTMSLLACAHLQASQAALAVASSKDALWTGLTLVNGLAVGSDAAGSPNKIWLAADREVNSLSPTGELTLEWQAPRFTRILRLEAGDLDGDGSDEWLVLLDAGSVRSVVVGMRDGSRQDLARPWSGYLRMLVGPDGSPSLVAQSSAGHRPFFGPIYQVSIGDKGKLERGEPLPLPRGMPLYDFFWMPGSNGAEARLFSLEATDHIAERDPRSPKARIWRSDSGFVVRPVEIEREFRGYFGEHTEEFIRLAPPVPVGDFDGDGDVEALLVGGTPRPAVVFENMRFHQGGDVRLLEAGERGLTEVRRSPLMGRVVAAAVPWTNVAGRRLWVAAVWTRHRAFFKRPETRILLLDPVTGDLLSAEAATAEGAKPDVVEPTEAAPPEAEAAPPEAEDESAGDGGQESAPEEEAGDDSADPQPAEP